MARRKLWRGTLFRYNAKEKTKAETNMKHPKFAQAVEPLLRIGDVTIYAAPDGSYVCLVSDLDICNDGWGPKHGDPDHVPETAYYNGGKFLNADKDRYIV